MGNFLGTGQPLEQGQQPAQRKGPVRPPPPRHVQSEIPTDRLIDGVGQHLTSLKADILTLRGQNADDARKKMMEMMQKTNRDMQRLSQQIEPQESRNGRSKFYRSLSEDKETENLIKTLFSVNDELQQKNKQLLAELKEEKENLEKEEAKNAELLLRLSKVAGQKLMENNPAVTDLSDQNRPTKLGEIHCELYDNEWTNAFEGLQEEGYDEEYAITTLYLTLINVFDFCTHKADTMLKKTEDAVNFLFEEYKLLQESKFQRKAEFLSMTRKQVPCFVEHLKKEGPDIVLQERWRLKSKTGDNRHSGTMMVEKSDTVSKHIKAMRKETSELMVPAVQKAYIKASWIGGEFVPALKPYIRKCIFLCWMMVVQSPPLCFHIMEVKKDAKFDKNLYKEYTVSGDLVKFVVWPALLLHEKGPLLTKGVAQGCKSAENSTQ